jgi:hypothetical protein
MLLVDPSAVGVFVADVTVFEVVGAEVSGEAVDVRVVTTGPTLLNCDVIVVTWSVDAAVVGKASVVLELVVDVVGGTEVVEKDVASVDVLDDGIGADEGAIGAGELGVGVVRAETAGVEEAEKG